MKIFWKKIWDFGYVYFAEINFKMRKVLRKLRVNDEKMLEWLALEKFWNYLKLKLKLYHLTKMKWKTNYYGNHSKIPAPKKYKILLPVYFHLFT